MYRFDGCSEMQSVDELQISCLGATQQTVSGSDHARGRQHRRWRRRKLQFFTPHITRRHIILEPSVNKHLYTISFQFVSSPSVQISAMTLFSKYYIRPISLYAIQNTYAHTRTKVTVTRTWRKNKEARE